MFAGAAPRMRIRRKTIVAVSVVVTVAILPAVWLYSVLANPDRYRPEVISYLEAKTGKQIEIGHLQISWIPLAIHLQDFGCKNPKPFPPGYFLKAASIDATLNAWALLHRRVEIKSLVLHDPIVNVITDADGAWNFENLPSAASQEKAPNFALRAIPRVTITGGTLFASSLIDPSDRPGPVVLKAHNLAATLEQVDFDAFLASVSSAVAQGEMKADSLHFGIIKATRMSCTLRLQARQAFCRDAQAEMYGGSATGELSFNLSGKNPSFQAEARIKKIDISHLLAAFGSASGKMTGIMEGDVTFAGEIEHTSRPLARIHGAGHVTVRNGRVPSIKLSENLRKLARFNDRGPGADDPSSFSSISADLELADQRISSKAVAIVGYGVNVNASGSVSVSGADDLKYLGVAEIVAKQGFFTNTMGRLSGATLKNGRLFMPFRVGGTIGSPIFTKATKAD